MLPPLLIQTRIVIKLGVLESQATVPFVQCEQMLQDLKTMTVVWKLSAPKLNMKTTKNH